MVECLRRKRVRAAPDRKEAKLRLLLHADGDDLLKRENESLQKNLKIEPFDRNQIDHIRRIHTLGQKTKSEVIRVSQDIQFALKLFIPLTAKNLQNSECPNFHHFFNSDHQEHRPPKHRARKRLHRPSSSSAAASSTLSTCSLTSSMSRRSLKSRALCQLCTRSASSTGT